MDKKGQGEQFNWIFVIVAGAIILAFFTAFTFKYIELQEKRQNVEQVRTFGENIQLLEASGLDSFIIDDSEFQLGVTTQFEYFCLEDTSQIRINRDQDALFEIKEQVVFAPDNARVDSFDAWVKSWNYPYFIVNMIYLSEPDRQYILVSDVESRSFVQDLDIELNFNVEKIDRRTPIESDGTDAATIMFFTRPSREDFTTIQEQFNEYVVMYIDLNRERITFFEQDGTEAGTLGYQGEAMLLGAMFSSNFDAYECGVNKAMNRLERISKIYATKALLLDRAAGDPACRYRGLQQSLASYPEDILAEGENAAQSLTNQNEALGGSGCPVVF